MQGADNDSDLLQNSALFGGSVLHGEPVSLQKPEVSLHLRLPYKLQVLCIIGMPQIHLLKACLVPW